MAKELYVGNLSFDVTEEDLVKLFSVSGTVTSVHLITDPVTKQFKGCGYVRMSSEAELKDALSLDGALLINRTITVSIAKPQKPTPQGRKGKPFSPKGGSGGPKRQGGSGGGSRGPKREGGPNSSRHGKR